MTNTITSNTAQLRHNYGTTTAAPKYDKAAKPRNLTPEQVEAKRRELINRNSFGSVNYNK
ncbi:DUF2737 family protein [Salmonella enterica]